MQLEFRKVSSEFLLETIRNMISQMEIDSDVGRVLIECDGSKYILAPKKLVEWPLIYWEGQINPEALFFLHKCDEKGRAILAK